MLSTIEQKLIEAFNDKDSLSREELVNLLKTIEPEANLDLKITHLEQEKFIDRYRVGTNGIFYKLKYKPEYEPEISDEIFNFAQIIQKQFGTELYCIWNTGWLNEFTEHNQVKKLIIIEIEKDLIEPLYNELKAKIDYKLYLNPDKNTVKFNSLKHQTPAVIKPFIPKSPILKRMIKKVKVHTPLFEKIVLDLKYYGAPLGFISSIFTNKYAYDFNKLIRYAKHKPANQEMKKFMTHISPPMKFKWKITKDNIIYTLEIQIEKKQILSIESTGHWKSETGGTTSFKDFLDGQWHNWLIPLYGEKVIQEIRNTIKYL